MITPAVGGINSYEDTEGTRSLIKQMNGLGTHENSGSVSFMTGSIEQNKYRPQIDGTFGKGNPHIKANFNIAGGSQNGSYLKFMNTNKNLTNQHNYVN